MSTQSRRAFLTRNALAAALDCATQTPGPGEVEERKVDRGPDLAVVNGVAYTVDDHRPRAEASKSLPRTAEAAVLKRPYQDGPVSNLFMFGRKQNLAFEQQVGGNPGHV